MVEQFLEGQGTLFQRRVRACLVAEWQRICLTMEETWVGFLGWEEALEEDMANHFNIPPWRIHGQRSLVAYGSMGSKKVR